MLVQPHSPSSSVCVPRRAIAIRPLFTPYIGYRHRRGHLSAFARDASRCIHPMSHASMSRGITRRLLRLSPPPGDPSNIHPGRREEPSLRASSGLGTCIYVRADTHLGTPQGSQVAHNPAKRRGSRTWRLAHWMDSGQDIASIWPCTLRTRQDEQVHNKYSSLPTRANRAAVLHAQ